MVSLWSGAELGGARGRGGHFPPMFWLTPKCPPKYFRSLSESPTQTIDSSPCCKTGPSSGPPQMKMSGSAAVHGHVSVAFTSAVRMVFSVVLTLRNFILVVVVALYFLQNFPNFCVQIYGLGFRFEG